MNFLKYIPFWLKNKYSLALIILLGWMLFFDRNDVFTQLERRSELKELESSKLHYSNEIRKTREELMLLNLNKERLEKYAREKYFMKRDDEDLFVISGE
ncbi:MAG TPA: septum formation initiator family protein [Parasegetibacter sp.]